MQFISKHISHAVDKTNRLVVTCKAEPTTNGRTPKVPSEKYQYIQPCVNTYTVVMAIEVLVNCVEACNLISEIHILMFVPSQIAITGIKSYQN